MFMRPHRVLLLLIAACGAAASIHSPEAPAGIQLESKLSSRSAPGSYFERVPGHGSSSDFIARSRDHAARLSPDSAHVRTSGDQPGWTMRLLHAETTVHGEGLIPLPGRSLYYLGNQAGAWHDSPHFAAVAYRDVYPGIDIVWQQNERRLQYDFHVAPGADPARIRIAFDEISDLKLEAGGDLTLITSHGTASFARPYAWQDIDGERRDVSVAFALRDDASVGFSLGEWDDTRPLVIDPVISYSSYLGGDGTDEAVAMSTDADGNIYIAGVTDSADIFTGSLSSGPHTPQAQDVYVAKLAPDGTLQYLTYLGGESVDRVRAIAVDPSGSVYVAGTTESEGFAILRSLGGLTGNYQGNGDGFIARLNPEGELSFSSYLGGERGDNASAIALDEELNVYIAGSTASDDFVPVSIAIANDRFPAQPIRSVGPNDANCNANPQPDCYPADGFVVKISAGDEPELLYATYLGGSGPDGIFGIDVDADARAVLGGGTGSTNFPGVDPEQAYQPLLATGGAGGAAIDGFVARLSPEGSEIEDATYLGGAALDRVLALALDADGDVYVTGLTSSRADLLTERGFPVSDGSVHGGGEFDAFVSRLRFNANADGGSLGSTLVYSTYLGGNGSDQGLALALNDQGRLIVVGETDSDDFPIEQAWQLQRFGGVDGFVAVFDMGDEDTAPSRRISSYMGGSDLDRLTAVAALADGRIHVAGVTRSLNASLVAPYQAAKGAGMDAFIASIELDAPSGALPDLRVAVRSDPMPVPQNETLVYSVEISNEGSGAATGVWTAFRITNATLIVSGDCMSHGDQQSELLCPVGDLAAGARRTLTISARPRDMGSTVLVANVVRADQTDVVAGNNSAEQPRLIVDNSGGRAAVSWPALLMLVLLAIAHGRWQRSRRA